MRRILSAITLIAVLSACGAMGEFFPDFDPSSSGGSSLMRDGTGRGSASALSIRPETLVACRGHVLVPAIGMAFVPYGGLPPASGQFLREESLTPPYRVLPPGVSMTMDNVPSRLNVDLDRNNRIINLRCG